MLNAHCVSVTATYIFYVCYILCCLHTFWLTYIPAFRLWWPGLSFALSQVGICAFGGTVNIRLSATCPLRISIWVLQVILPHVILLVYMYFMIFICIQNVWYWAVWSWQFVCVGNKEFRRGYSNNNKMHCCYLFLPSVQQPAEARLKVSARYVTLCWLLVWWCWMTADMLTWPTDIHHICTSCWHGDGVVTSQLDLFDGKITVFLRHLQKMYGRIFLLKEFWKSVNVGQSYGQESSVLYLTHGVVRYFLKIAKIPYPMYLTLPLKGFPLSWVTPDGLKKLNEAQTSLPVWGLPGQENVLWYLQPFLYKTWVWQMDGQPPTASTGLCVVETEW